MSPEPVVSDPKFTQLEFPMAEIPQLRADGRNWTDYREKILRVAAQQEFGQVVRRNGDDYKATQKIGNSGTPLPSPS
jgi:hypothetical protein